MQRAVLSCSNCIEKATSCYTGLEKKSISIVVLQNKSLCISAGILSKIQLTNASEQLSIQLKYSVSSLLTIFTTVLTSGIYALVFKEKSGTSITSSTLPILATTIIAYTISTLFTSIYDVIIETMFLCYSIELSHQKKHPEYEMYAPTMILLRNVPTETTYLNTITSDHLSKSYQTLGRKVPTSSH